MVAYKGNPKATEAEKAHMARVKEMMCCVCHPGSQRSITEVHHVVRDNKRLGNFFVLPLCQFHHVNVSKLRKLELTYVELVNESLGIQRTFPQSKIVARR